VRAVLYPRSNNVDGHRADRGDARVCRSGQCAARNRHVRYERSSGVTPRDGSNRNISYAYFSRWPSADRTVDALNSPEYARVAQTQMPTYNKRKPLALVRGLGLWATAAVIIGGMVGQSIFLVSSQVARDLGSVGGVLAVWVIGGATVLFASFCYAELGAALPHAGGDYVYIGRGLGPKWGFLFGWTSAWIQGPGMAAAIAAGLLRITSFLLPSLNAPIFSWSTSLPFPAQIHHYTFTASQLWAAVALAVMAAINYFGVRTAGQFQVAITGLKVSTIILIVGLGFTLGKIGVLSTNATFELPAYKGPGAVLTSLVPVMMAYNGFQCLGFIGGEIKDPQKTIPRAAILGVLAVIILYFLINVVYFRVLGLALVANSQNVASDAAAQLVGAKVARWLTIFMVLSALGSLHGSFLTRPRVVYAMARDGQFFSALQRVHPKFRTPSAAILFHGALAVILVLTGTFEQIYSVEIFAIWIFIGLTAVSLIRLRTKEPLLPRPYRAWAYPWTPLIVAAVAFSISANLWLVRPVRSSIGIAIILLGLPFYGHWRKRAVDCPLEETAPTAGV
jgi:APA family basic amino acid/polyamine antiporter